MRQTNLSLEELRNHFNGTKPLYGPRCMLINEVGEFARMSGGTSVEAQKVLVSLLKSGQESDRWIAIRFLKETQISGSATSETDAAVAAFETDSRNASILPSQEEIQRAIQIN